MLRKILILFNTMRKHVCLSVCLLAYAFTNDVDVDTDVDTDANIVVVVVIVQVCVVRDGIVFLLFFSNFP